MPFDKKEFSELFDAMMPGRFGGNDPVMHKTHENDPSDEDLERALEMQDRETEEAIEEDRYSQDARHHHTD